MAPHPLFPRFVRAALEHQTAARRDRAEADSRPGRRLPAVRN